MACIAYIITMHYLTDKLLTVTLALVLGLSPLQGAVASMLDTHSDSVGMQQMMAHAGDMSSLSAPQMNHDCSQHMGDSGCQTHAGASSHCSSCVVGIHSAMIAAFTPILESGTRPSNEGFTSYSTTSLYRPPRG